MGVVEEIREAFASFTSIGVREIKALPAEYPALVVRTPEGYGVAIEIDNSVEVSERFSSCRFYSQEMTRKGEVKNYLMLGAASGEHRYEFASLCAQFVDPGEDGKNREKLIKDPYSWWSTWTELVGNVTREKMVYDVIAELMVLQHKFNSDKTTEWTASRVGTHDIECSTESYEVKSTIKRTGASLTISSQHQLEHFKRLYIYFCRMEESLEGESVNSLKEKLKADGYDETKLEKALTQQGFERGSIIRNKKYKALERRIYEVDDNFPKITKDQFVDGKYPDHIVHIEYTIDLEGISYSVW